ncbi:MAG: VCBS repeat-containing protein [bacterium]|nr:VCBS repeat-containing protein [bacterium]
MLLSPRPGSTPPILFASILLCLTALPASAQFAFAPPVSLATGLNPSQVAAADWTGDDDLDLIVVNRASDDANVFAGDGAGGFTLIETFAVGNFPQGVIAADLDGLGGIDLVTTSVPFNTGNVSAWLGNGDGTFQTPVIGVTDDGPRSVQAVDFDGDLALDLVTPNAQRGNISVFLGEGDGTFGPEIRTPIGSAAAFPTDLAVADFDGDLLLDVITSNAQSADNSLGLVLGDGDGTFGPPTAIPTTCTRPESVVAGFFDADANVDVAVACFQSDEIAVLLGNGNGTFAAPVRYGIGPGAGDNPYWILAEDMDGDGELDLVTANNGSFSVYPGVGDGTFGAPTVVPSVSSFFGAVAADFNEDGRPDLALADFGGDFLRVYLGQAPTPVPGLGLGGAAIGALLAAGFAGLRMVRRR